MGLNFSSFIFFTFGTFLIQGLLNRVQTKRKCRKYELEYFNISFTNSLPSKTFRAYVVLWNCFIDGQVYLFFCHKNKPFPHLDINFNCKLDAPWSFWNWGISLGEYPRIFPSFSWGIYSHVRRLDQSRASKNIWWIITSDILYLLVERAKHLKKKTKENRVRRFDLVGQHIIPQAKWTCLDNPIRTFKQARS